LPEPCSEREHLPDRKEQVVDIWKHPGQDENQPRQARQKRLFVPSAVLEHLAQYGDENPNRRDFEYQIYAHDSSLSEQDYDKEDAAHHPQAAADLPLCRKPLPQFLDLQIHPVQIHCK